MPSNLGFFRGRRRQGRATRSAEQTARRRPFDFRHSRLEQLEERTLLSVSMQYDHVIASNSPGNDVPFVAAPTNSSTPPAAAYAPAQIKQAYGIDQIKDSGVTQDGTGETIAIIDAYDNPMFVSRNSSADVDQDANFLASDLHKFDVQYNLPEPAGFFTKVDQTGGTNYPTGNTNWGTEIALDVEWVHALAPGAKIILIEANSDYDTDLLNGAAVWARDHSGAQVVTMSFGGSESSADATTNSVFQSPADHGITWLASTGDDGVPGGYPAFSPDVVAVGGTTLAASGGVYSSESGWSDSGGSISNYESQPTYQQGLVVHSGTSVVYQNGKRATPDVAFDADPNSGVPVYDSYGEGSGAPWVQVGGTSFSSPAWAALIGITDEIRANHGLLSLDGQSGTLPTLYQIYSDPNRYAIDFHDITTGSNGYSAATGYDLVTGMGTPKANMLLWDLAGVSNPILPTVTGVTPSLAGGTLATGTTTLTITFNKIMVGGGTASNYELQSVGADGLLGTDDDSVVPLGVSYNGGTATLTFLALSENVYRLTVRDTITDVAGNQLDGNGDGIAGGNWTTDFVVTTPNTTGFAPVSTFNSGVTSPNSVATGDFNGDGDLDLAVANYASTASVGILLGNGNGTFAVASTISPGSYGYPGDILANDFNGDGKLDLAVEDGGDVVILLGNGAGGFSPVTTFMSDGENSLVAADFNGDGKLDLACVSDRSNTDIDVLLGNGNGGFGAPTTFNSGGVQPLGLAVGDFNGDGKFDLVVANNRSNTIGVLLGNGHGGFGAATAFGCGGTSPLDVAVSDFNSDGKADIVVTNSWSGTVGVLLGNGSGGFATVTTFSSGAWSSEGIAVGDLNGDGKADVAIPDFNAGAVGVLFGNGNGGFAAPVTFGSGGTSCTSAVFGDFNGDGRPDIAVTNYNGATVGILKNTSTCFSVTDTSPHGMPFEIALGNFGEGELIQGYNNAFDGDGRLIVGGTPYEASSDTYTTANSGQTVITAADTLAGLTVSRQITVPSTGNQDFARTVDAFTNCTTAPITTTVTIVGNLGSDGATTVFTSDGTGIVSPSDLWIGTDDGSDGSGTPAVIHYIHGPAALLQPVSASVIGDNIEWTYNLTVPAGQTVPLAYFTIVASTQAAAIAAADALVTPSGFGGQAAAFLSPAALQSLPNFVNTNQAPVLLPAEPQGTIDEDTPGTLELSGTFINNGQGTTTITDADPDAIIGAIAVVGTTGNGAWSYSLDGSTFYPVGTVSTGAALLLPSTAQLCYTPDMMNAETATISYRAWDTSYGTPGTKVDTTISGGTTAFSLATDTASLIVTDLNDAPVLTPATPLMGVTAKDAPMTLPLSDTFINNGGKTTTIIDVDHGAIVGGIAIEATTGYGTWSYSLDGTTFYSVGNVGADSALLLPSTAQLCYTPDGIHGESATITYRAWDMTDGTAGMLADTTLSGGTTAFSSATDTASLLVNDAPVLTAASPSMGATNEDTTATIKLAGTFINNGSGTTTITDVDRGAIAGGIALVGTTGRGAWSYSLDGTTFYPVATVSTTAALLLPNTAVLCYTPDLLNRETPTITYRAWDTTSGSAGTTVDTTISGGVAAFSLNTDTATLTVSDVNDAPVLTAASPLLGITNQATPIPILLVGTFVNHGTGTTTITDVDHDAIVGGIAIVATTGLNVWSYSLDGTTFYPIGAVSTGSGLLLPSTAQLRYAPDGIHSETATITYCAWDTTSGTAGSKVDISSTGGTTAFSSTTDTASLTLDYVPPTVTGATPTFTAGTLVAGTTTLAIAFSEKMVGGGTAANYQLKSAGADGLLGTDDDVTVPLTASYTGATATLTFPALPENVYRLAAFDTLTDLGGNKLAGGNWVTDFVVVPNNSLFPNPSTVDSGVSIPYSVAVGDFNGDGIADLAVANDGGSGSVGILLGDGRGGFHSAGAFSSGGNSPQSVAVGDFNGDGKLDVLVANSSSGTVALLLGNGSGGLGAATIVDSAHGARKILLADFNGDGKLDFAIADGDYTVAVRLGNGNGTFGAAKVFGCTQRPLDIATADFNGDGKLDLVMSLYYPAAQIAVLFGDGTGAFAGLTTFSSGLFDISGITVGDFNGDGKADVAVSGLASSSLANVVSVRLGDGHGGLGAATTFSSGGFPGGTLVTGDFNGDGSADIAVANYATNSYGCSNTIGILQGTGGGSFAAVTTFSFLGSVYPIGLAIGDFNGDQRSDLVVANNNGSKLGLLLNCGGPAPVVLNSPHGLPFNISVGNFGTGEIIQGYNNAFDGDGRLIVGGAAFQPSAPTYTTTDSGQSVVTATGTTAGLTVSRKITVPNTGSQDFAQTVDTFTNSSGSAIATTVTIVGNLGSDAATNVFATSDGTGVVGLNDLWIGTDDASDGSGTPAVIHYIRGPGAMRPTSIKVVGDNIEWTYDLNVPAGQTVRLGYFTIVATTRAAAVAAANVLVTPSGFGGQAAALLSSAELLSMVNFVNTNHSPVLTPAEPQGTTDEDTPVTVGLSTFINNGPGTTTITDPDSGAILGGIAVVGATGNGAWSYSLDGSTFYPVGAVGTAAALLLPGTAQLRYTPDMLNGETATITYRAWDTTYGAPGMSNVDTTISGGATTFSSATDTASLIVTDANDAPVLTPAAPSLGATTENTPMTFSLLVALINHGSGTTTITDADHGAIVGGIALVATTGYGSWSYSLDGTTFNPVGTVSASSALLLPSTALLCYASVGISTEKPTITYRAWDATDGTPGTLADATNNGGATAFSSATDTASLLIHDAPMLTATAPSLGTTDENAATTINLAGTFINNGPGTTTISDVDSGAIVGGIALVGVTGHGAWSYSLDGKIFASVGAVSPTAALLLPNTAELRYAPDLMNGETATITYRAWDTTTGSAGGKLSVVANGGATAFSSATDTATLTVASVNDAPVLTAASPSLGLTNQSTPVLIPLTGTFINHGTGTTSVADVDTGATMGGIAIVGTSGLHAWFYSLDGTTFSPIGTVGAGSALLLPSTAQLRYAPDGVHSETPTLTYYAWDMTSGVPGDYVDTSNIGGTTAFSSATDTASLSIDYIPPWVSSSTPAQAGGTLGAGATTLTITFSEAIVGGGTAANYQLQGAGPDGLLGTADDVIVPLTASYAGTTATLAFAALPQDVYRLTVRDSVTDLVGYKLDGNSDGAADGDWSSDFVAVLGGTPFVGPNATLSSSSPYSIAMGDFNGDGITDMAVANDVSSGTVGIFLGDGRGGFSSAGTFSTGGYYPKTVAVSDLNGDGKLDIIVANYGGTVSVFVGNGNGTFGTASTSVTSHWLQGLAVGDFNGDGKLDVATVIGNTISIFFGNGNGGFGSTANFTSGGFGPDALVAADFNGDGKLDLAVANSWDGTVGILLGNGSGSFGTATTFDSGGVMCQSIAVGDFNGDGKADLAVTNEYDASVGILLGDGSGGFGSTTTVSTMIVSTGWSLPVDVAVADFNGDGKADLAVTDSYGTVAILTGNGAGLFSAATIVSSGGSRPEGVAVADLNGDGWPDLVVANSTSDTVGILLNSYGLAPQKLDSPHDLPFEIAVGNVGAGELVQGYNNAFDGDGRLMVGSAAFQPNTPTFTTADSGQSVITAAGTAAGLTVSREITVPNTGNDDFARTVDSFTNSTSSTITTTVTIVGNLGSDANTMVFATSDGDTTVETGDQWIGTDDASDGSGTPAVIHYIHGPFGLQPVSVSVVGDNIEWTYHLTVPAGQTVRLESFTIVATTRAAAIASANALVTSTGFGGQATAFLSQSDLSSLANFAFTASPQVVGIFVAGSAWTSSSLAGGYSIPIGSGAQLLPLPAANINQIKVTFSENVIVDQSDLLLTGVNTSSYDVSGGTFSYDPVTFTATWTLPESIGADKLMLSLNADGSDPIRDSDGNRLDGDWTNPTSTTDAGTSSYPSGNGLAGGDFHFRLNVLPGDANQDGSVDIRDFTLMKSYWLVPSGATWAMGDFNADGSVDIRDFTLMKSYWLDTLPAGKPVAGSFPADVSLVATAISLDLDSPAIALSQADVIPNVARADFAANARLWNEAAPAGNVSAFSVPEETSTGTEQTLSDRAGTVLANQARAHDVVLAGGLVPPSPSEASWLWDAGNVPRSRHPASSLESLTDAVDNALAAYDYEPYTV